jgi:hypothetical protein
MHIRTILLAPIFLAGAAHAAESPREPKAVLNALADRIYVLGETSGNPADMISAEAAAADEVRRYIASGSTEGLLAKQKGEQSPLASAAYMGYPNIVAALLTSRLVRDHINDADDVGMTPWIAANFSMKQSLWSCNPAVFENPFKLVPMIVTQPYYLANPMPPYVRTREVLEEAGAQPDISKARELWLTFCKNQSEEAKTKVLTATDLQKAVQELGTADLIKQLDKLQENARGAQKNPGSLRIMGA